MKKKQEQHEPGSLVEAVQPCALDVDGISYVFNPGTRVQADHPAVQSNPGLFQALESGRGKNPSGQPS